MTPETETVERLSFSELRAIVKQARWDVYAGGAGDARDIASYRIDIERLKRKLAQAEHEKAEAVAWVEHFVRLPYYDADYEGAQRWLAAHSPSQERER